MILALLAVLAIAAVSVWTLVVVATDGYGPRPTRTAYDSRIPA